MPENEKYVSLSFGELGANDHASRLDDTLNTLRQVLEKLMASNKPVEVDSRRHFYDMFNREADEYDRDFHKKYHDDLNTTLIFVSSTKSHSTSKFTGSRPVCFLLWRRHSSSISNKNYVQITTR